MSLIYNICFLIGMNKKVKQYVVSNYFKSFNSDNVFINMVCLLFIIAAIIICMYFLYRAISNALYMYRLNTDFYKLQNMGVNVKNYNILYYKEIKKKYILNRLRLTKEVKGVTKSKFKNKNVIGFIPDNYIVIDIDKNDTLKSANFLIDKIPKDTVCEKTPNGYHYYFENDTGKPIHTYVQLKINNEVYAVDILGVDSVVTMSPSNIEGKNYYWINSIFTHTPAKLSENMWIVDLIKDTKPFNSKFNGFEFKINITGAFIIIDNIHIEDNFRFFIEKTREYSKKIKLLYGTIYVYDDNYYFMTRSSFCKYKNKKKILSELTEVIEKIQPVCIIDLSIIYSNYLIPGSIFQVKSCIICNEFKNYKNNDFFPNYVETTNVYKKTNYIIDDTVTIYNYDSMELKNKMYDMTLKNNTDKILIGPESIYITMLLSNYFNIPSVCNTMTYNPEYKNNTGNTGNTSSTINNNNKIQKDDNKKIMTNFMSLF